MQDACVGTSGTRAHGNARPSSSQTGLDLCKKMGHGRPGDATWANSFEHLLKYVEEEGHPHVQLGHELWEWAQTVRKAYHENCLLPEQTACLRSIGFCFEKELASLLLDAHRKQQALLQRQDDDEWHVKFETLSKYCAEHGHAHPRVLEDDGLSEFTIGVWARDQRLFFKSDRLSNERIALLRSIDFCFDDKMAELLRAEVIFNVDTLACIRASEP